jgi:type IV pilus assembly protein PilM
MANTLKRPGVWGIDLGQCALKAIRLENVEGEIRATAFDYIEHPKILSQPDADPDQLTREALEKFLSRNDLKGDTVAISVPGQSGLARFVKLPPVDEKKIPDIVRFEAKQQIPFPLEEVVWAYQRLGTGMVIDGLMLDTEVGLFAMKRDMVNRYLQHFKEVNVEVHFVQMAPLALCNFLAHDQLGKEPPSSTPDEEAPPSDKSCIVALDIGADNSNLVITDGEKIIWQRPIPLGGNHFTRALTKDLKLTFAKAEHLKRNAVKSPDLKKILAALKPVLNDFVSEVQRSLGYFTNTHRDATIQYMLGLGNAFRLPGLQKYLQEKLQLDVRKLQKINRLGGDEAVTESPQYVENVLSFGVAHGLALQGLKATRLHTNLLPPEIHRERFVRAKKPWAVAAAAVLLLMGPPLMIGYAAHYNTWTQKGVADAIKKLQDTSKAAQRDTAEYNKLRDDTEKSLISLKILSGGEDERVNWLSLNTVINEALPRPDGTRLLDSALNSNVRPRQVYFLDTPKEDPITKIKGISGRDAWNNQKIFREFANQIKQTDGKQADPKQTEINNKRLQEEAANRRYLVQVNIEGIEALYSDNLPGEFFSKIANHRMDGMRAKEAAMIREKDKSSKLPRAGWVVEIRGFTYHIENKDFVLDTLVEHLNYLASTYFTEDPKKGPRRLPIQLLPDAERILKFKDGDEKDKDKDPWRMSHIFLFDYDFDARPRGSDFLLIQRSVISKLMLSGGGGAGEGKVAPTPTPNAADKKDATETPEPKGEVTVNRGHWKALSSTGFADVFVAGAGGGGIGGFEGRKPMNFGSAQKESVKASASTATGFVHLPVRTEFIILFVWQEPLTAESANLDASKK